ncbi:MAG: hypothetical protein P8016_12240 [Sedimentisphaerales bacterium]
MRHSDINLTMSRYTHTFRGLQAKAIEALPRFNIKQQEQIKTGTDDMPGNQSENEQKDLTANLTKNLVKYHEIPALWAFWKNKILKT